MSGEPLPTTMHPHEARGGRYVVIVVDRGDGRAFDLDVCDANGGFADLENAGLAEALCRALEWARETGARIVMECCDDNAHG